MTRSTIKATYTERKEQFEYLLGREKRMLAFISVLRLLLIAGTIYFIILSIKSGYNILLVPAGLMVVLFFVFVAFHKNRNDKRRLLIELIAMNQEELDALENKYEAFDEGRQFSDPDHPWSLDLDLFGEKSLYQYINRTATHPGPAVLADYLTKAVPDEEKINSRQEVIRELNEKLNLRQHFTANARLMQKDDLEFEEVIRWSKQPVFIEKYPWTKVLTIVMTAITTGIIFAGIQDPSRFILLIPQALVNLTILSPFFSRTNRFQDQVSKKHNFSRTYSLLLDILAKEDFSHPDLKKMNAQCKDASGAIHKLSGLLNLFDQRLNFMVGFTLNALVLFDFYMLHSLAAWNRKYRNDLASWVEIAGRSDALFSLAGFAYNHPGYSYPEIRKDHAGLRAKDLGHPLIPETKRVDNSVDIKNERVVVITGANMAGKSTFLRTIGVNMALAYAGCPVCAKEFITAPYQLYSSMRTADSLKDDESYFFAEIKRLKKIVDKMMAGEQLLILLDEVLKGTNATDKQRGSKGLIKKSVSHDVLCFIATHDLALGEMAGEYKGKIVNFCFESYIKELELIFDYRIQPGIAKNMNASFLMKQMGIMD